MPEQSYEERRDKQRRDNRRERTEAGHEGRRWIWWSVGIVAFAALGAVILAYVGAGASVATAPAGVIARTANPGNIIANYEWFKQQYQDIGAMDARLSAARDAITRFEQSAGPRTGWQFEERQESARLNQIVAGLEGQRASMIAEYNARTQMANRDIFRTHDLPSHIDTETAQ